MTEEEMKKRIRYYELCRWRIGYRLRSTKQDTPWNRGYVYALKEVMRMLEAAEAASETVDIQSMS